MDATPFDSDLEALLRESGWVRGLARGLLGEGAAADDLAQDVLAAALERRPGLQGARLRGWLRSVARRLAWRGRERGELRARAERESARDDDVERDSERRLDLQRELAAALTELEPTDRTVLVLRYLEGLPTRDLAARLDVTESAARKRVSRALERLRDVLDRRSGGNRNTWSLTLAGLLVPRRAHAATGVAAAGGATLVLSKATWTLLTAAALGALFLGARHWLAVSPAGPTQVAKAAPQLVEVDDAPISTKRSDASTDDTSRSAVLAPDAAVESGALVRVVDTRSAPVAGARLAWIDASGQVQALDVGDDGEAPRPPRSAHARFYASAEGHGSGYTRAAEMGSDVRIELPALRVVTGRVLEEGTPPREPIPLRFISTISVPGVSSTEFGVSNALNALGLLPPAHSFSTAPDGTFRIEEFPEGWEASLWLPSTHLLTSVNGERAGNSSIAHIGRDALRIEMNCVRLPMVRGSMVWEDTGEPVHGGITVVFHSRVSSSGMITTNWLDEQGRFRIGIPVEQRALAQPLEARGDAVTEHQIRLRPDDVEGAALPFEHVVDLVGVEFPLDVGVLRVPRAPTLHVLMLGPEGEPVSGAAVVSEFQRATADREGRVTIAARAGRILALAVDHALTVVEWDGATTTESGPFEVHLSRGATLEVLRPAVDRGVDWSGCSVRLQWDESPFEGAGFEGRAGPQPMPWSAYQELFGHRWKSEGFRRAPGMPGSAIFKLPAEGSLLIPGLRGGGLADLELLDAADHPVASVELRVPHEPGRWTVDLDQVAAPTGRLRLRVTGGDGRTPDDVSYALTGPGRRRTTYYDIEGGVLDLGPVAPGMYTVTVRAAGYLEREFADLEVAIPSSEHSLELEPARALAVLLHDASGRPLRARSLELRGAGGSWEPTRSSEDWVGRVGISKLPREPLDLRVVIGARIWTRAIDDTTTEVALDLPMHGLLTLSVAARERMTSEDGYVLVRLRAVEGEDALEERLWVTDGGVGPTQEAYDLLPGRYELEVDLQDVPEGSLETDPPLLTSLDRREIEVRAGETTKVVIGP